MPILFRDAYDTPKGGRLHIIRVPVDPGREWQEAVTASGPDTDSDWDVRKVGDKYPPQPGGLKEREIILVNFGNTVFTQYTLDWAKPIGLRPEGPRGVFAVGEHKPQLHRELNVEAMAVISPEPCAFEGKARVCRVWWGTSRRLARLDWFEYTYADGCWFAFSRE